MFNEGKLAIFNTEVEPLSTGDKVFTYADKIVNIDELRKALNSDNRLVVIRNHVGIWSSATECQTFINTDRLAPETDYEETYTFTHWGRSLSGATNRKIVMSFKGKGKNAVLKASYFSS